MPTKQKSKLFDEDLVKALSHPTRAHAFAVFTERPASTSEIAAEVEEETGAVHHHVQKLLKLGCIEEVKSERRRGATEHYYRATARHYFDPDAWEAIPKKGRLDISMSVLRLISNDLSKALVAGTVDAVDRHLTRTRLAIDAEGFAAVHDLLDKTLEGLYKIREESLARLAKSDEAPVEASVSMMQFELPSAQRA